MTYFLWTSIFFTNKIAFGYSKEQMMAYVFLVLLVSAFVFSAPSNEKVGEEIGNGDLNSFLIRPVGYLRYWLTRDWASKLLNISFACVEFFILWLIFKPQIALTNNAILLTIGLILCIFAAMIHFIVTKIALSVAFWAPENTWGFMFIIWVCIETLAGMVFPLDILPKATLNLINLTPFPYLIYYPIAILVGKYSIVSALQILLSALIQLGIYYVLMIGIWKKGLKAYSAYGS